MVTPSNTKIHLSRLLGSPDILMSFLRAVILGVSCTGNPVLAMLWSDDGDHGCRQFSEAARIGSSTSTVTSQTNLLIFMLTEIRLHAKFGSRQWCTFLQALALGPKSFVRLNGLVSMNRAILSRAWEEFHG